MTRAAWIAVALAIIALARTWSSPQHEEAPAPEVDGDRGDRTAPEPSADLGELRRELRVLRAEQDALQRAWTNRDEPAPAPGPEDKASTGAELAEQEEERIVTFDLQLESETRDAAWSARMEDDVRALLTERAGTRALSVECRSTICRVEVEHDAPEIGDLIFGSKVARGGAYLQPSLSETGPSRSLLYLHRGS